MSLFPVSYTHLDVYKRQGLQFLERTPQRAFAGVFQAVDHQLVVAACFVQGQPAAREHAQSLARRELCLLYTSRCV